MNCWKSLKGKVKFREPLKRHTTFKVGGKAEVFIEPRDKDDLKSALRLAKEHGLAVFILGRGSNILAADKGIKGAVLKLSAPFFKRTTFKNNRLYAGSGALLAGIISSCLKRGLSGTEFLSGIPGTLGGALAMNAGTAGRDIGSLVRKVEVMDYRGNTRSLGSKEIKFAYRKSSLAPGIILGAELQLKKEKPAGIRKRINDCLKRRRLTQDLSWPSAGCVFKNPRGDFAGRLIDACGLKGRRSGGARVSLRHANFIINTGNARATDILKLIEGIKKEVHSRFGVVLEPEIKIW